jgi:hypothetical protein
MGNLKDHAKFAASVLAVYAVVALLQDKFAIPVIGPYLPGGSKAA